jgi:N-methylhydantoinase B
VQAREVYGIALDDDLRVDSRLTSRIRQEHLSHRLQRARPPVTVIDRPPVQLAGEKTAPLYHGVVQLGGCAIAADSGAVLAVAPAHWTDGCPRLEIPHGIGQAREWLQRSYLDPLTGRLLYTEAVPAGSERSFATLPDRWTEAAPAASAQG